MGNCLQAAEHGGASIPRDVPADGCPIKQSSLPIIFLLGGPGAGKRTQSMMLADKYGFLAVNAHDVVREEVTRQTVRGVILGKMLSEGKLIPADVLLDLIKLKMLDSLSNSNSSSSSSSSSSSKTRGFLISGYPRSKDQSVLFERILRPADLTVYLAARDSLLRDRVMARTIATAQRREYIEDNVRDRVRLYTKSILPVLRHVKKKLVVIDGEKEAAEVFQDTCNVLDDFLGKRRQRPSAKLTPPASTTFVPGEEKSPRSASDAGQIAIYS